MVNKVWKQREIPAGTFKAQCLKLMDEVRDEGGEIIITKRGKAVAKLVPVGPDPSQQADADEADRVIGCMEDTVTFHGDVVGPFHEDWQMRDGE